MVDGGLRGQGHLEVAVRAASEHISGSGRCGGRAYFVFPYSIPSRRNFFCLLIFSCFFFIFVLFLHCVFNGAVAAVFSGDFWTTRLVG